MASEEPPDRIDIAAVMREHERKQDERREANRNRLREARALYSDGEGEVVLRPSFAVYLDGLGTKDAVGALTNARLREQVALLDRFRWYLHDDDEWAASLQRFLSFSDNVILGVPNDESVSPDLGLWLVIASAAGYQLSMTASGLFLRGGIAAGPLYIDDRFVTGQGLVDAVLLEEQVAVFPRVVLSEQCVQIVLDYVSDWPEDEALNSPWNARLLVDADGRVFVNYLVAVDDPLRDRPVEFVTSPLDTHRQAVETCLERFESPGRIREKYVWAAQYHNYVCEEFFGYLRDDHRVNGLSEIESEFPRVFRRIVAAS